MELAKIRVSLPCSSSNAEQTHEVNQKAGSVGNLADYSSDLVLTWLQNHELVSEGLTLARSSQIVLLAGTRCIRRCSHHFALAMDNTFVTVNTRCELL